MWATDCGHKDVVELLLAGNANPNITDKVVNCCTSYDYCYVANSYVSRIIYCICTRDWYLAWLSTVVLY